MSAFIFRPIVKIIIFLSVIGFSINASCQVKSESGSREEINCRNMAKSVDAMEKLIGGTWDWQKSITNSRLAGGKVVNKEQHEGLKLTFYNNKTGLKKDKQGNESTFSWEIVKVEEQGVFHLRTEPALFQNNELIICDGNLVFSASAVDGSDHYFAKAAD